MDSKGDTGAVIPECNCPWCGKLFDRASHMMKKESRPKPGDFSVCINCSMVNRFGPDLRIERTSSDKEWSEQPEPLPSEIRALRRAILLMNSTSPEEQQKWKNPK